jgi:hypothetical protein
MKAFPKEYAAQLAETYGQEIAGQITEPLAVHHAPLPQQPGQTAPYVEVGPVVSEADGRKLHYVAGFGEGVINKASFAAELALQGKRVVLSGQNRKGTLRDESGKRSATYTQAVNSLAVYDAASKGRPMDILTHSYGSIIFDEMVRLEPDKFKDSAVVVLAPAGSVYGQRLPALGLQWLKFMKSEADQSRPMEFPDSGNHTGKASAAVLAANPARTGREVVDLWKREVDYEYIAGHVASLAVLTYAEDRMYPNDEVAPMLTDAARAGYLTWAVPVASARAASGEIAYGGAGAVHDDEQYNPGRVVDAALQFLS